jgi:hypothetical protein
MAMNCKKKKKKKKMMLGYLSDEITSRLKFSFAGSWKRR